MNVHGTDENELLLRKQFGVIGRVPDDRDQWFVILNLITMYIRTTQEPIISEFR
jgi:hypothetical protein